MSSIDRIERVMRRFVAESQEPDADRSDPHRGADAALADLVRLLARQCGGETQEKALQIANLYSQVQKWYE